MPRRTTTTLPRARARSGCWPSPKTAIRCESYVNLISTTAGGTHDSGLRDGLFQAVKGFIELHALTPKGVKLMPRTCTRG